MVAEKISKIKDSNSSPDKGDRQKLVEEIKKSNNILITVSRDPSVDALSAALGLTAIVDKMDKHGTAIFSGKVPPAIEFLNPDKIFADTADSLRDFIIALSKEKADHLRYKVDGDVVKIYVTPYKTVITDKDLEFSQGDYNVELVIALGVGDQKDLDIALAAHGRILHDATVTTINVGEESSNLGTINLHAKDASSLSEIIAEIGEDINKDSKEKLLDEQIATALMTGIVATTDRFSNEKTTSRTMTIAANLMSEGADQQLISMQLEEAKEEADEPSVANEEGDSEIVEEKPTSIAKPDGSLSITHDNESSSRLTISTLPPEETEAEVVPSPEEVRIPTATEILSQLAAAEKTPEESPEKSEDSIQAQNTEQQGMPSTRTYLEPQEVSSTDTIPEEEGNISGRMSSEQSPSVGAEPLRGESSITSVIQPLNEIDTMAPPVVDPKPADGELPNFNIDESAEAILQAALNSASPSANLSVPSIPTSKEINSQQFDTLLPPPPPPLPDFSMPPPPLPDFTAPVEPPQPQQPTQPQQSVIEPQAPVISTLPPEDMILAGQNQQNGPQAPSDPSQFQIPGQ